MNAMAKLYGIYKQNITITKAAELERAIKELRTAADGFKDEPIAGMFAAMLILDIERQSMENSGGDPTKTRGYALGKIFAWYNKRALEDPRTYTDDKWEQVAEECGELYKLNNERLVWDVILALVTDLERMSKGGGHGKN